MIKRKKNKKYKSNKLIILLSIAFAAMLVAAAGIAYFMFVTNSANNPQEQLLSSADETVEEVPFYTSYKPYKAVESETEKEVALATVFGTAYSQYGGELKLNENMTFSLYAGISNSDDSEGTFTLENDKIKAIFKSGEEKEFVISQEYGKTVIIVPMGLYNIYFKP